MKKLKEIIDNTVKKFGLNKRLLEYKIMDIWEIIVGEKIAKHTSAHSMHQGVLFINVNHPLWVQHLSFSVVDIKNKLNNAVGLKVVKEIRFQAGNICTKTKKNINMVYTEVKPVHLSYNTQKEIELMVENIGDSEIRSLTANFIKRCKINELNKQNLGWRKCPDCGILIDNGKNICFFCELKDEQKEMDDIQMLFLESPWLSFEEMHLYIDKLSRKRYGEVKKNMLQKLWVEINSNLKYKKNIISKERVKIYVMLYTGLSPEKLTNEIIWQTLGENIANKLLEGEQ